MALKTSLKAIWQDLHLAATLDRVKSRPPVGLVRCICKNACSRGEKGTGLWTPVKLGVSNVHIFVPIWMIPEPVRHVQLLASRDIPPKTKGWVKYKEGWWVGGWGPRYLAIKRERGPARVPRLLEKDSSTSCIPLIPSTWNHKGTWLRHTP